MDAPTEIESSDTGERRLSARIVELEAEVDELRRAAAAARSLVADEVRRRVAAERELEAVRGRQVGVREAASLLAAALARRGRSTTDQSG